MAPHELDILISTTFILGLVLFMVMIVIKDLIIPSQMSTFASVIICGVLLTAPSAFIIKNIYILFASWNL